MDVNVMSHVYAARRPRAGVARARRGLLRLDGVGGRAAVADRRRHLHGLQARRGRVRRVARDHLRRARRAGQLPLPDGRRHAARPARARHRRAGLGAQVVAAAGELLSPSRSGEDMAAAIREERFLILPHPEVARVLPPQGRRPRPLAGGMQRLQATSAGVARGFPGGPTGPRPREGGSRRRSRDVLRRERPAKDQPWPRRQPQPRRLREMSRATGFPPRSAASRVREPRDAPQHRRVPRAPPPAGTNELSIFRKSKFIRRAARAPWPVPKSRPRVAGPGLSGARAASGGPRRVARPPASLTRGPAARVGAGLLSTPSRPRRLPCSRAGADRLTATSRSSPGLRATCAVARGLGQRPAAHRSTRPLSSATA